MPFLTHAIYKNQEYRNKFLKEEKLILH
jgi:actin-related protein 3